MTPLYLALVGPRHWNRNLWACDTPRYSNRRGFCPSAI